jgi:hypothetical protein
LRPALRFATGCHWLRPLGSINAPYRTSPRLAVDHLRRRGSKGDDARRSDVHVGAAPPAALDYAVAPISISTDATSDADLQSADSGGTDPRSGEARGTRRFAPPEPQGMGGTRLLAIASSRHHHHHRRHTRRRGPRWPPEQRARLRSKEFCARVAFETPFGSRIEASIDPKRP